MKQAAIVAVVLVLTGFVAARQDVSDVFYKAVHLQDVKGDLEAAIPLFEQVVTESKDPSLAAKAQLRIGMCNEKLGLTRAQQAYQRVIDRYPQQSQEVGLARERLAVLVANAKGAAPASENPRFQQVTVATALPNAGGKLSPDGTRYAFVSRAWARQSASRNRWTHGTSVRGRTTASGSCSGL
jgi:tetratricopeptide (TPR) repeat protein